jgi:antitoxin (DNA-binding transcriptional repressor) of toxin-antitoxin stability system
MYNVTKEAWRMSQITLQEAQANVPALIAKMQPGESVQIMDQKLPIARLTIENKPPCNKRKAGSAKGQVVIVSEDDDHLKDFTEYMP